MQQIIYPQIFPAYGSMYADDISQGVGVASANVYYAVTGSMTGGLCSSAFTFQNSHELRCNIAGTYLVVWGMSMGTTTANEDISGAAMINSTEVHQSEGSGQVLNGAKPIHISGQAIISLNGGDRVRFCVQNEDGAHNITVYHANMTLIGLQ